MSWHIPASIAALAIFLICCVKAVPNSWDTSQSELARQMPATALNYFYFLYFANENAEEFR